MALMVRDHEVAGSSPVAPTIVFVQRIMPPIHPAFWRILNFEDAWFQTLDLRE